MEPVKKKQKRDTKDGKEEDAAQYKTDSTDVVENGVYFLPH